MTISTEPTPLSYNGDDSTVDFPVTWGYQAKSHVLATHRDSSGNETTWVLDTDYTLTDPGDSGTLTATTPPATGEILSIELDPPNTQAKSLPIGGPFPSTDVEDGLDLSAQRDAKLEAMLNRCISVPKTDTSSSSDLVLPNETDRASQYLVFGLDGSVGVSAGTGADSGLRADLAATGAGQGAELVGYLIDATGSVRDVETKLAEYVSVTDFGATGDGATDDTTAIQAAIDYAETSYGSVYFPAGTYKITTGLTVGSTLRLFGDTTEGSIIDNTTNDIVAITVTSATRDADRTVIENLKINHEAATKYAIVIGNAPFCILDNVRVECNDTGYGGLLMGDENTTPSNAAYLGTVRNCRFWAYTTYGVRINSTGTQIHLIDNHVGSTVAGAHGAYINSDGVKITRGQYGANNTGGIGIYAYNAGAGDQEGPTIEGVTVENVAAGEYGISIDGVSDWISTRINDVQANFNTSVVGTLVRFKESKYGVFENPKIKNPTSGGTLVNFGTGSIQDAVICSKQAAEAPISSSASATRPQKRVIGDVSRSQVADVTTNTYVTVVLDAVDELPPGFVAVHNGVGWNFFFAALADDAATSVTPPSAMGTIKIINDDDVATYGTAGYDTATPACVSLGAGADFEVTTGALAGTTGTNLKLTVSAHTDGKVYVEARKGASNITGLFESAIYGV